MSSNLTYDCFRDRDVVEPYPDISGPGVLLGFLGTAYVSIFIIAMFYLVVFDPTERPPMSSRARDQVGNPESPFDQFRPNPVDCIVLGALKPLILKIPGLQKWSRHCNDESRKKLREDLNAAFRRCIAASCDVQMLTGIGILSSGYASMKDYLSAYHWQMIVYLAWFSNLTHLSGLTFLRRYLQGNKHERWFRVAMMTTLTTMLIISMVPTGFFTFTTVDINSYILERKLGVSLEPYIANASSEARCFFHLPTAQQRLDADDSAGAGKKIFELDETMAFHKMMVSTMLAFFTFAFRILKLIEPVTEFSQKLRPRLFTFCNEWILKYDELCWRQDKRNNSGDWEPSFVCQALIAIPVVVTLFWDLFFSMASEIFWLIISAAWGTIQLVRVKTSTPVNEGDWTFGQILPIFLFILPLFALAQDLWRISQEPCPPRVNGARPAANRAGTTGRSHDSARRRNTVGSEYGRSRNDVPLLDIPLDDPADLSDSPSATSADEMIPASPSQRPEEWSPSQPLARGLRSFMDQDIYKSQRRMRWIIGALSLSAILISCLILGPIIGSNPDLVGTRLLLCILIVVFYQIQFFYYLICLNTRYSLSATPCPLIVKAAPAVYVVLVGVASAIAVLPRDLMDRMRMMAIFWAVFISPLCIAGFIGLVQDCLGRDLEFLKKLRLSGRKPI